MEGFSLEEAPEFELWLEADVREVAAGFRRAMREALSQKEEGFSGGHRDRPALGEAGTARGDRPAAADGAPIQCGRGREGSAGLRGLSEHLSRALGSEPSTQMQSWPLRLQKEVEERATFGASQIHSATSTALSVLEVPWLAARKSLMRSSQSIKQLAWDKRAWWPSWGRQG